MSQFSVRTTGVCQSVSQWRYSVLPFFILVVLLLCSACNVRPTQTNESVFEQENQEQIVAFEAAQDAGDTARCNRCLSSSIINEPALFCGFIEKANPASITDFLQKSGFIRLRKGGCDFDFQALCMLNHKTLMCLLNRVKTFPIDTVELHNGLIILGMNLCEPSQRDSFIRVNILSNRKKAVRMLSIISNVLKRQKEPSFEAAFAHTIALADKNCVRLFLQKSGYMQFNRFTDEYTSYHPEKLSHLSEAVMADVLTKAKLTIHQN